MPKSDKIKSCKTCYEEDTSDYKEPCMYCHGHSHWETKDENIRNQLEKAREFAKLPKWFRESYLKLAAEKAAGFEIYGGGKMPVIREISYYEHPEEVGYVACIKTIDGDYFVDTKGKISKPDGQ